MKRSIISTVLCALIFVAPLCAVDNKNTTSIFTSTMSALSSAVNYIGSATNGLHRCAKDAGNAVGSALKSMVSATSTGYKNATETKTSKAVLGTAIAATTAAVYTYKDTIVAGLNDTYGAAGTILSLPKKAISLVKENPKAGTVAVVGSLALLIRSLNAYNLASRQGILYVYGDDKKTIEGAFYVTAAQTGILRTFAQAVAADMQAFENNNFAEISNTEKISLDALSQMVPLAVEDNKIVDQKGLLKRNISEQEELNNFVTYIAKLKNEFIAVYKTSNVRVAMLLAYDVKQVCSVVEDGRKPENKVEPVKAAPQVTPIVAPHKATPNIAVKKVAAKKTVRKKVTNKKKKNIAKKRTVKRKNSSRRKKVSNKKRK